MLTETSIVQFVENHIPPLQSGKYQLQISQTLQINKKSAETYEQSRTFYIASERFTLPLQSIHSVFPPESSTGDYGTTLPHLVLNRSTLPWERNTGGDRTVPWLALLLFHESDGLEEAEKISLTAARSDSRFQFSDRFPAEFQEQDEKISILKIPDHLLPNLIPTPDELKFLNHVRHISNRRDAEQEEIELAIVIGNRLPKPGRNIVHLVSLENYFLLQASRSSPYFVSLKSWEFQSEEKGNLHRFRHLLMDLNGGFKKDCPEANTLRRPRQGGNNDADQFLSQGYVPLPHHLRNGQNTLSWYRGPLLPGRNSATLPAALFPVRATDRLLRYLTEIDMFDVSYAAAYQIGQLMALEDRTFLTNLYNWKRQQTKSQKNSAADHLAVLFERPADSNSSLVLEKIKAWFEDMALLKHLPFNYLVPDPLMLPEESIRFFWIDPQWLDCFSEGAFGIGENWTSSEADKQRYLTNKTSATDNCFSRVVTGFLMRSRVVSEFPALNVKGSAKEDDRLTILRKENLSDTVMICLFEGEVRSIQLSMGAEILHFGLERGEQTFVKALRSHQYTEVSLKEDSWKDQEKVILNIAQLSQQLFLENPNAANFGLAMVENSPQIVFKLIDKPSYKE